MASRVLNFNPNTVLIDPKTGRGTREFYLLLRSLADFALDNTSDPVLTAATQTLTNKTMDGDANTFRDIPTSAFKSPTGNSIHAVTGTAGANGNLVAWDADGNAIDAESAIADLTPLAEAQLRSLPLKTITYTVSTLPTPTEARGEIIFVNDETGGATLAFYNGTNWVRVSDLATVS